MKAFVDGDKVFVATDDFVDLQESQAVFGNTHEFSIATALAMVADGAKRHVSFIDSDDWNPTFPFAFKEGGKILKVTVEWVESSEASPEAFPPT